MWRIQVLLTISTPFGDPMLRHHLFNYTSAPGSKQSRAGSQNNAPYKPGQQRHFVAGRANARPCLSRYVASTWKDRAI
jgi:hypothetical protein